MNTLDKVYNLTIDIKNIDVKYNSYAKFFDDDRETSVIRIKLLNDKTSMNLENCIVEAYFILADNTYHNEACKIINSSEGVVELQLCQKCLVKGENIVRLSILKDNEISNTPVITYEVRKGLYSNNPSFNNDPLTPILSQMLLDIKVTKVNQIELQERYEKSLPKIEGKIKEVNNKITEIDKAKSDMTTTISDKVKDIDTRFNALTSKQQQDAEVIDARVDFKGVVFNSLKERIDNTDKILRDSTVSTVTTESDFTTVEATSNGYFEDVKLEGKTLVNLALPGINPIYFNINMFKTPCEYTVAITFDSNKSCTLLVEQVDTWKYVYRNDSVQQGGNYVVFKFNSTDFDLTKSFALSNKVSGIYDSTVVYSNIKMVILEGDHTQNPPSYFEGLKSVGDVTDEIVVSSVKGDGNLFDGQLEEVSIDTTYNGKFGQLIPSSSYFCSHTKPFMIKPNTTYVVGINDTTRQALCFMYDYNMNPLNFEYGNGSKEFTTPSNARYCRVRFGLILTEAMNYEMYLIEKDSTDLTHQSDKKRLLYYNNETQTWEKPILRQWDSIEKHADGKYYYHKRSGEVVLNGSEGWFTDSTAKPTSEISTLRFKIILSDMGFKDAMISSNSTQTISDKFKFLNNGSQYSNGDIEGICADREKISLNIAKSKLSTQDVQGFKQWLQANPTTVVYQLAEEKVYECTNIDLITYDGETNFIVNCGAIAPKTTLKVHSNISNVVSLLQKKVSLLESNVKASQEVQDMMILETDMRMLDIELALMEFMPIKLNLGGSDMLRSATYFNFLKNHIVNETYSKEYLENVMNKYLATRRINQDEYDELYKMLYPPVYDIELPIEY